MDRQDTCVPRRLEGYAPLAGRIAGGLSSRGAAIIERNRLDFDTGVFWKGGNAHRRTRGRVLREIGRVDFIHFLEIAKVGQENGRLHDMGQGELLRLEDRRHAVQDAPGLFGDIFGNDLSGFRIEWDLAGAKNKRAGADGLRVRPDRRRRLGGGDDLLHAAQLSGKNDAVIPRLAKRTEGAAESTKLQHLRHRTDSSAGEQAPENSNNQSITTGLPLDLGVWSFSGCWSLEFGALSRSLAVCGSG